MTSHLLDGLTFPYLVREGEDGDGPPPLVVLLHGYGSTPEGMMGLAPHLDPRLTIVAPRAGRRLPNGGFGWYPLGVGPVAPVTDVGELEASRAGLLRFAGQAARAHGADAARVFLLGFSQGAALALCAALTEPESLAGVVAMSGRVVPEILPHAAPPARTAGLPALLTHGVDDALVPVEQGRIAARLLRARGMRVQSREYAVGHALCRENVADVDAWLRARAGGTPPEPAR